MLFLFNDHVSAKLQFLAYRYRFLMMYVFIGVLSIVVEILILHALQSLGLQSRVATGIGVFSGIFLAYWANVRFNFKVPKARRNRAFILFVLISLGSFFVQWLFRRQLHDLGYHYEGTRLAVSGVMFFFAYLLHRKFSFRDFKQLGVAVYASGVEDIQNVAEKVSSFPNFIHVDIVDKTMTENPPEPAAYRLEVIRAYWPKKRIDVHIMSRTPSTWLPDVIKFADMIILHAEIDEDLHEVIARIHQAGKKAGLCILKNTPIDVVKEYLDKIELVQFLTIETPGMSGQEFDMASLERIREINQWPNRSSFEVCVDGGVNETNIGLLNVEKVVSGSSVLTHENPRRQIMRLQTSSNYETT